MKIIVTLLLTLSLFITSISSQEQMMKYEVSKQNPFGKYNPTAPKQLKDYKDLIGECDCKSFRKNKDGSWAKPVDMIWRWKYIMNGKAVQDETLKADGKHSGSIRQFNADSLQWNVHYYSSGTISNRLATWNGNKTKDGKIVLYKDQKAPNGTPGFSRLTFYDISKKDING